MRVPNAVLRTKSGEEFVVHLNMLSAVTKELKESEHSVQDKRKRPYQPKMHTEVIEPEWPKTRTKYPLRGHLESEENPGDQKARMEPNNLPDNPFDGQLCQPEKRIPAEKKPEPDTDRIESRPKILVEQKNPPPIAIQPLISSRTRSRSKGAKSVQTPEIGPITVSVSTNTEQSVSFAENLNSEFEFEEYRKTNQLELQQSRTKKKKNEYWAYQHYCKGTDWYWSKEPISFARRALVCCDNGACAFCSVFQLPFTLGGGSRVREFTMLDEEGAQKRGGFGSREEGGRYRKRPQSKGLPEKPEKEKSREQSSRSKSKVDETHASGSGMGIAAQSGSAGSSAARSTEGE